MEIPIMPTVQTSRPISLVVLCILTFFGSILGIMNGVFNLKYAESLSALQNSNTSGGIFGATTAVAQSEIYEIKRVAIVNIIEAVLTCIATGLMFTLRKAGFWIYLLGAIVWIGASLIMSPTPRIRSFALFTQYQITLGILIRILFVVLYAFQLKYMYKTIKV